MVTMPLPPLMSTPRTGGAPEGALPAPPGPAVGEMPPFAMGSEPFPVAAFPAPGPVPFIALPGPFPRPMPLPVPVPPRPAFSAPDGDMDNEPAPPLLGTPTFEPGWLEITAPAFAPLPLAVGGVRFAPGSRAGPRPAPLWPRPEPEDAEPPPTEGGGGTILLASSVPRGAPAPPPLLPVPPPDPARDGGGGTTLGIPSAGAEEEERTPVPPDTPVEGGGAITFPASVAPMPTRVPRELPPVAAAETLGGGGTTLAAGEPAVLLEL